MQWKRFQRLLGGATGVVWMLCCSGIIFIGGEEDTQWFLARMALVVMLVAATGVSLWLFIVAWRERKSLEALAVDLRVAERNEQRKKKKR